MWSWAFLKAACPDLVTGSWCEAAASSEGPGCAGSSAAPAKHRREDLHNAGDVLHRSKPGGDTSLHALLKMLAGAQLRCVPVQFRCSWP